MCFRPTVHAVKQHGELRSRGKLFVPGLFDGQHCFKLEAKPAGRLTLRRGEVLTGIFIPLFRRSLEAATKLAPIAMNEALKREAEEPDCRAACHPPGAAEEKPRSSHVKSLTSLVVPFALTDPMPESRPDSEAYIWLVPMTCPLTAFRLNNGFPLEDVLRS